MLVSSPSHPLAAKPKIQTRDLEGETILLSKVDCSYRRSFQQILDRQNVRPDTILEFNSVAAIKQCVMEGVGITILPEIAVAREIAQGRLAALTWGEGEMEVALLMIWYRERWRSPSLEAFMMMTREALKANYDA